MLTKSKHNLYSNPMLFLYSENFHSNNKLVRTQSAKWVWNWSSSLLCWYVGGTHFRRVDVQLGRIRFWHRWKSQFVLGSQLLHFHPSMQTYFDINFMIVICNNCNTNYLFYLLQLLEYCFAVLIEKIKGRWRKRWSLSVL